MKEVGYTKHYGQHNVTHERLILLCVENVNQRGTTMAVPYDALDGESRAELIAWIDGPECQAVKDSWVVLQKKIFQEHPKQSALNYLMSAGLVKSYSLNDVTVFYTPNKTIPLVDLVKQINEYEAKQFNVATTTPFGTVAPETQAVPVIEQPAVAPVVQPVAPVAEPKPDNNELLTSALLKIVDKLDDLGAKLDSLSDSKTTVKKTKKD